MLNGQVDSLRRIIEDAKISDYAGDAFWNLIQAIITGDAFAGMSAVKNVKDIIFHMPTLIFWDKMKRYLLGTFKDYEDQIKMSQKFNKDNKKYNAFVKRQILLINELDDDLKIDHFANLTRSFLLVDLEEDLYFKLAKTISICTSFELLFLQSVPENYTTPNTSMVSLLYQNGLFIQHEEGSAQTRYELSELAKALKQNSLNFNDGVKDQKILRSFDQIAPLEHPSMTTWQTLAKLEAESSNARAKQDCNT